MPDATLIQNRTPSVTLRLRLFGTIARWVLLSILTGTLAGSASAFLLVSLDWATRTREAHLWLIALLPLAGLFVGCLYRYLGSSVERGNNLILDEVHAEASAERDVIPLRMTPLILLGTILTHLFGGSAGREGTAIQTGASLADQLSKPFRLSQVQRRVLLMAGISAGFGSVFGTPLAGTIFGIEVLAIGHITYEAIGPCLIAAFVGEMVTAAWGVHHTVYTIGAVPHISTAGLISAIVAGIVFGLMARLFAHLTHTISHLSKRYIAWSPARPFVGGVIVAIAVWAVGTTKYIGLGIPTIVAAFHTQLPPYDFAAKTLFTSVTLGMGFKGGEVTPLFYIGATLGNALSRVLPLSPSLLAGMGFVAVFAGAANTPIASTLMAVELFGGEAGAFAGIACIVSYLFSGHSGIYHAQRIGRSKYPDEADDKLDLAMESDPDLQPRLREF